MYFSEIAVDVIIGLVGFFGYSIVFILSVITPFILDWSPTNTFIIFGLISFAGAVWTFYFIKETKGLNDKQKKTLFIKIKEKETLLKPLIKVMDSGE